nr:protein export cytoplasm protein SecA2 ATPase RNA helicase [Lactococcus taiwanensis]
MKMRKMIVRLGLVLLIGFFVTLVMPVQTAEAANDRPPAATPVSPLGQVWLLWVAQNGLMTQPNDQNIVATNGTSMTVAVPLVTTNYSGIFGIKHLSSVGYQQYNNSNGWPNVFTGVDSGNLSVGSNQPSTNATAKLSVPTTSGTYYYQLRLTYNNNGSPETVYSDVFAITVMPKPIDATGLVVTANQKSVLWGQQIGLNAQPTPTNSTATIGWRADDPKFGVFSSTSGQKTSFTTKAPASERDAVLQNDSGTPINLTATATNSDHSTVEGTASATLGGVYPKTVQRGENFNVKPDALNDVQYPSNPDFRWFIYKDQTGTAEYTPSTSEHLVQNTDTLQWQNVQAPQGKLYYQLVVTFNKGTSSAFSWYTNIAPLTITATNPELHAVPNLQFALSSGTNPTIADFYKPNGVMMQYAPSKMVNTANWDGNNAGVLAITSGGSQWRLNVQFSPFKNMTTQRNLGGSSGGTAAFSLHFADGTTMAAKDDSQPVTLYNGATQNVTTTTSTDTSLKIPQTASIQPGTYQSTATWTLVKAP